MRPCAQEHSLLRPTDLLAGGDCPYMFLHNLPRTEPDKSLQSEEYQEQVIHLTQDRKKVRQEIYREDNIGQHKKEEEFGNQSDPTVLKQSPEEPQELRKVVKKSRKSMQSEAKRISNAPDPHLHLGCLSNPD